MLYIYLDKSGDLDFDFKNKKESGFFTICALLIDGQRNDRAICSAIKHIRKRTDIKGGPLSLETLKEFCKSVKSIEFGLFAVTLDKRNAFAGPSFDRDRICRYIAGLVIKDIDFIDTEVRVTMPADKFGQAKGEIPLAEYLRGQVQGRVDIAVPLNFLRASSRESAGLQAAGIFAKGVRFKNECGDNEWCSVFKEKIRVERIY